MRRRLLPISEGHGICQGLKVTLCELRKIIDFIVPLLRYIPLIIYSQFICFFIEGVTLETNINSAKINRTVLLETLGIISGVEDPYRGRTSDSVVIKIIL